MTNLTEQWKKGELPRNKIYYVNDNGEICSCRLDWNNDFIHNVRIIHPKILSEVPSYEEWQQIQEQINKNGWWYSEKAYKKLKEENTQLKELLKECRDVAEFAKTIVNKHKWFDEIIAKIDQVLQEKE